jgi:Domain of unknown function (DUF1906)/Bacterial SH3 domain
MPDIIDVSFACGDQAGFLAGAGVQTIIRYYSRDTGLPGKRMSKSEALSFTAAGLRLAIVHEAKHGNKIESFTQSIGELDGAYARGYAARIIGQPTGSAIYFAVDVDASAKQIHDSVLPYFQGVTTAFATQNGQPNYRVGVYGSGATCEAVLDAGLATFAWLAQSKGWAGYKAFLQSNRWSLLQSMPSKVGEIDCDLDRANGDFGEFWLSTGGSPVAGAMTVIARPGLRLRAGPGTDFDVLQVLPFGTKVHPVRAVGDWTMVDLAGDAAADGFVSSHFLSA